MKVIVKGGDCKDEVKVEIEIEIEIEAEAGVAGRPGIGAPVGSAPILPDPGSPTRQL